MKIIKAITLGLAFLFSASVYAGVEASISIVPKAGKQTEFLATAEEKIDEALFKNSLVVAANQVDSNVLFSDFAQNVQTSNADWQFVGRQKHLYSQNHSQKSWPLLSVSIQQGDVALTMGSDYQRD